MSEFGYEKFISRFIPMIAFFSIFVLIFYAFITVITLPDAEKAGFVQEIRDVAANSDEDVISQDVAHRSDRELQVWITTAVSEALSFNKDNFAENAKTVQPYFTDAGYQKYQEYLISSGIAESLRTQDLDMSVYIEDKPIFLNSSVIAGKFKWLYQLPVAVSLFPKNAVSDVSQTDKFVNRKIKLRLQITRSRLDDNPEAMQIEDWVVSGY